MKYIHIDGNRQSAWFYLRTCSAEIEHMDWQRQGPNLVRTYVVAWRCSVLFALPQARRRVGAMQIANAVGEKICNLILGVNHALWIADHARACQCVTPVLTCIHGAACPSMVSAGADHFPLKTAGWSLSSPRKINAPMRKRKQAYKSLRCRPIPLGTLTKQRPATLPLLKGGRGKHAT